MTDFSSFKEAYRPYVESRTRIPWELKARLVKERFPSVELLNWDVVLKDDDILVQIFEDIIKAGARKGSKASMTPEERGVSWRELTGEAYSTLPFRQAFALLVGTNSLTMVARKVNFSRSRVHRLLNGEILPDIETMCQIADGYGRHPSYFVEYRAEAVVSALTVRLLADPEYATVLFGRLGGIGVPGE